MKSAKKHFYIVIVLLLIVTGIYACTNDKKDGFSSITGTGVEQAEVNISDLMASMNIYNFTEPQNAPDFELTSLEGKMLRLSQYRGKVVLLSFWTTW